MFIKSVKNYAMASAAPLCLNNHPRRAAQFQKNDSFEKQETKTANKRNLTSCLALTAAAALFWLTISGQKTSPEAHVELLAKRARKDASKGKFWIKPKTEIEKSIKKSHILSREKLDGKRTGEMLTDFLNSDVRQFQYHAHKVFTTIEHDKMINILKPYLEDRTLTFHYDDGHNLRGQIFSILEEKGTSKDIPLIQQYLNPQDEWFKLAENTLNAIVRRGI